MDKPEWQQELELAAHLLIGVMRDRGVVQVVIRLDGDIPTMGVLRASDHKEGGRD